MSKKLELKINLKEANNNLAKLSAENRLKWAIENFGTKFALSTSFGIQSSVLLHMLHKIDDGGAANIIWVDTGYLPAETYQYVQKLTTQLNIEVKVAQSDISPARMEALFGKLWESNSIEDFEKYNLIRKVQPLEKTLNSLDISCWASGVRRSQTDHRKGMDFIEPFRKRLTLRPILDWSKKDIFYYMQKHQLPQHPLFEKGYSTVGDWHSSEPDTLEKKGRETRFGGLKQECGIHLPEAVKDGEDN